MSKINKAEIPIIAISLIQVFSLFVLSTSWGRVIALISIIFGSIIAVYSYTNNKTSKQRLVLWLILTIVLAVSLVLQLTPVQHSTITLRIIRNIGMLVMFFYLWLTDEL